MKIEVDEKVYIQKFDVAGILRGITSFPGSFMDELFGGDEEEAFFMNGTTGDACKFAYVFGHPENVGWILEQDWILDYNEYAEMSIEELRDLSCSLIDEYQSDIDMFNAQNLDYRKRKYREMKDRSEKCRHKITSLNLLIGEREGKINFKFPKNAKVKVPRKLRKRGFFGWLFGRND